VEAIVIAGYFALIMLKKLESSSRSSKTVFAHVQGSVIRIAICGTVPAGIPTEPMEFVFVVYKLAIRQHDVQDHEFFYLW